MIRIYYMKLAGDCSKEQSLALLYGENQSIPIPADREELYQCLPQERKEAVNRAKSEAVARKRLYTGAFLQHVLSVETGIPMEKLHYCYNQWGKPELAVEEILKSMAGQNDTEYIGQNRKKCLQNIHFNLSHSGDYVVLAVSDNPVGIDVEHKTKNYEMLSKRCFCKEEYLDIMSGESEQEKEYRFLQYWTMKEAYIKCVGEGMRISLNSFCIERKTDNVSVIPGTGLYLRSFFLEEAYCISVCSASAKDSINETVFVI